MFHDSLFKACLEVIKFSQRPCSDQSLNLVFSSTEAIPWHASVSFSPVILRFCPVLRLMAELLAVLE